MNCHEFEAIVVDLVRGEGIGSELGTRCWAHAANCPHCAERLLQQEKLTAGLAVLAANTEQPVPKNEFEDVLRREFRKQFASPEVKRAGKVLTIETSNQGARFQPRWGWAAVAAAVLLASVVGILAVRSHSITGFTQTAQNQTPSQAGIAHQPNAVKNTSTQTASTGHSEARRVSSTSVSKKRHAGSRKKDTAPASHPANRLNPNDEVATNFYPLPYGSGLSMDDGWQIVRVSLRPDALASLGLVLPNLPAGTIKADLVLGEDGMARAIRFVE
jgi:hypothetical protein